MKDFDHRFSEFFEIIQTLTVIVSDETEIEISKIMVYSATSRNSAHHMDSFFLYIFMVDFFQGVLISSDDDGRFIDIKYKIVGCLVKIAQCIFFQCKIDMWICDPFVFYEDHLFMILKLIYFPAALELIAWSLPLIFSKAEESLKLCLCFNQPALL